MGTIKNDGTVLKRSTIRYGSQKDTLSGQIKDTITELGANLRPLG